MDDYEAWRRKERRERIGAACLLWAMMLLSGLFVAVLLWIGLTLFITVGTP